MQYLQIHLMPINTGGGGGHLETKQIIVLYIIGYILSFLLLLLRHVRASRDKDLKEDWSSSSTFRRYFIPYGGVNEYDFNIEIMLFYVVSLFLFVHLLYILLMYIIS